MIEKTEQEITKKWKGDITTPLLSICTVTYNHEKFITEALDSFLMQETDFPFEIVVDEDCSTDGTAGIISTYVEKFPTIIKANLKEKNIGLMANFTENFKRARGKYIALCEGDDFWTDNNKLQYQLGKMKLHPDCDISFHPSQIVSDNQLSDKITAKHSDHDKIFTLEEIIKGNGGFCPTASIIIKQEVIDNLPTFFSKAPVVDYFIQIFGSLNEGALYINKTMSAYRIHTGGVWTSMVSNFAPRKKFAFEMLDTLEEMDNFFNFKYKEEIAFIKSQTFSDILITDNFSIRDRIDFYKTCIFHLSDDDRTIWLDHLIKRFEQQNKTIETQYDTIKEKDNLLQKESQRTHAAYIKETTITNAIQNMIQYPLAKNPIKKYKAYKKLLKTYDQMDSSKKI